MSSQIEPDAPDTLPATPAPGPAAAPDVPDAGPELSESERLLQQVEALNGTIAELSDRALRAQAELDNYRKRSARDIENAHKYALERFVQELLPVVDSLELGLANSAGAGSSQDVLHEGMELTLKKLQDVLAKFGVVPVDPAGEKFNPERHEAVATLEQPELAPGTVVQVMQKGYELNGRLIRPAMVCVSK